MNGLVTDAAGQPIPGATVVATHTPTNSIYAMPTNDQGRYNFQNMRVGGPYTVKFTAVGSADQTKTDISLALGQNLRLDVQMAEQATELGTAVVQGRRDAVINSDRTGAATQVSREQIERLPTLNRSFDDFTRLTPQANGQSFGGRNGGYNNFTIDGAIFNNSFGLSSTVGGQANAQPISLDAVDQIQVAIAPYDVRQGSFTGAGINAVTRSGTNKFSGSVYGFYRDQGFVGKKVGEVEQAYPTFDLKNYGFRVGGPIIKDKLFFFLNGEQERRNDPPTGNYRALRPGLTAGADVSSASAAQLDELQSFLQTRYGYNAGAYEGYQLKQNSDKATAKLDWNISDKHRLSVKYNYLKSYRDVAPSNSGSLTNGRSQSNTGLPFESAYYRINNNLNSVIAELNSTFGTKSSNNLTVGYTAFRDFRESSGGIFPLVDIGNGSSSSSSPTLTSFGYEAFSANNILNTDVFQVGDNYTLFLGKHVVTLGTYNEFYKFKNGFAPNFYGNYQFNSPDAFYASAGYVRDANGALVAAPVGTVAPAAALYRLQFSALPDGSFPFAKITAQQFGLFAQDEYTVRTNLKVTLGLRADVPNIPTTIDRNETAAGLTFRDGYKVETDQFQQTSVLFSPRIGFNWDILDNQRYQVRGGTGVFTGRVPFVWISNQASNNGIQFGSLSNSSTAFNPNVAANIPQNRTANTAYNLAVTDKDFKFPQVWRTNLAGDVQLPAGIIATLEGIYTKDLNAVYHENVNLPNAITTARGADNRPIYYFTDASGNIRNPRASSTPRDANGVQTGDYVPAVVLNNRINGPIVDQFGTELLGTPGANGFITGPQRNTAARPNITDAIVMRNSNKGYSYSITAQLRRAFENGLYLDASYTYTDARSVNDGGSIAQSIWRDRAVSGDPNANVTSYSNFLQKHRVIASGSYKREYLKHVATTVSVFYVGAAAVDGFGSSRFSYLYQGDMNGDGAGGNNDLIYVPRTADDIALQDIRFYAPNDRNRTGVVSTYTKEQQWADLNAYIEQDKYLKDRRGQYAERNGASRPWQHRIDFRLLQDIFTNLGQDNRNTLQFSLDIFNIGNLLNKDWGIIQTPNRNNLLSFQSYGADGKPTFQFPYLVNPTISNATLDASGAIITPGQVVNAGQPLSKTFRDDVGNIASRWQMQLGLRYIFN
jgi:Carboxypeptidase regulatory-like domain